MSPEDLGYTEQHEWVRDLGEGVVRFGITDHAQDALGDIVFVTLPKPGARLEAGEACGEVESTKSVSDVYAPVSGEVVRVNDAVETAPETLNSDPYGEGWLVEVRLDGDAPTLLTAADYEAVISGG